MRRFGFDISSLFNSFNNNSNSLGGINLSDYASIKNGSYGKLMKSYYSEQKKGNISGAQTTGKNDKKQPVDKTGLTQLKKESEELGKAVTELGKEDLWKQTNGSPDMDKVASAVKSFVKEYNDTLTQAGKVNSKDVANDIRYMNGMTSTMSKALKRAGISVEADGSLTVNEEELKKANHKTVKALFTGAGSYGSQIERKASEIARDTVMNSSVYGSNGALNSQLSGMFNNWV